MKRFGPLLLTAVLAAGFFFGVIYLFRTEFSEGGVYPAYSTLRADAGGAKVLFDSLARLPGLTVTRGYQPLEQSTMAGATIFVLGLPLGGLGDPAGLRQSELLAARGNRLVLSLVPPAGKQVPPSAALERRWGIRLDFEPQTGATRALYFAVAKDWEVLDRGKAGPLVVERSFGKGAIVLAADARIFGNAALARAERPELFARIIGAPEKIVFDEAHFGITESGSIVELARRFRMGGLVIGLALCAALFVWRKTASFPPVGQPHAAENLSGRTSASGLITLLGRHIALEELAGVCWREWLKTHLRELPAGRRTAAEAILSRDSGRPAEALAQIEALIRTKGTI